MAVLIGTDNSLPSFTPKFGNPTPSQSYVLANWKARDALRALVIESLRAVRGIRLVGKFKPNGTGRRANATVVFGHLRVNVSLCPLEGRSASPRTDSSIVQEILEHVVEKVVSESRRLEKHGAKLDHGPRVVAVLAHHVQETEKEHGVQYSTWSSPSFVASILAGEIGPDVGDMAGVVRAFRDVLGAGMLHQKFANHELGRAMKDLRRVALHAFSNGGNIEDLERVLKECLVEATMKT